MSARPPKGIMIPLSNKIKVPCTLFTRRDTNPKDSYSYSYDETPVGPPEKLCALHTLWVPKE